MMRQRPIQWAGIIFVLVWIMMNTHYALKPEVVTMDKQAVVARFVGQLSQLTLTDAELTEKTTRFGQALKSALNDYANGHHVIILDESAVLAGRRDVTPKILGLVAMNMRSLR
ncbi:MAG: TrbI F-type domain-containing protein [Legionellaceae bacterium]|nr:TrbI F-type domain-containing protein [Legionellaceae bacterium]